MCERCWVREEDGDQQGANGEENIEAEGAEAIVDVPGPDDAVVVTIPEEDMLLKGGQLGLGFLGGIIWRRCSLGWIGVVICPSHIGALDIGALDIGVLGFRWCFC